MVFVTTATSGSLCLMRRKASSASGGSAELQAWVAAPFERDGEFGAFLDACGEFGLGGFLEPDKNIVRGLAYYTGIVWEIFDRSRSLRAVAGAWANPALE